MEDCLQKLSLNLYTHKDASMFKFDGYCLYQVGRDKSTRLYAPAVLHMHHKPFISANNADLKLNFELRTRNMQYSNRVVIGKVKHYTEKTFGDWPKRLLNVDLNTKVFTMKTLNKIGNDKITKWKF